MKDTRGVSQHEFMKIVPQSKTMSQLRAEILESLEKHLQSEGVILKGFKIDQDLPVGHLKLSPEGELTMLVFIEKTWGIRFHEQAAQEFAKNIDIGTTSDLITIIIKLMNGTE